MIKIIKIDKIDNNQIQCTFNNGERRLIDISKTLDDKYSRILVNNYEKINNVKVGDLGEIYWENLAEIKNPDGSIESCNYDISPEFVYYNSNPLDIQS